MGRVDNGRRDFYNRIYQILKEKGAVILGVDVEESTMMLIVHSGDARSLAFRALAAAKEGNFEEADRLLAESREKSLEAHHVQTELLTAEAQGQNLNVGILLVHSQDHLMTSMLAQELIQEMVEMYKNFSKKS